MSILSALKQQNSSIDDLAKLPQAMIMQMAQKKQIDETMLAPILARKAELAEAFARDAAMKKAGQTQPTVMEQLLSKNADLEQPQPMAEVPDQVGVGQIPIPERAYAGGGIIAFDDGGEVGDEDPYEERRRQSRMQSFGTPVEELYAMLKHGIGKVRDLIPAAMDSTKSKTSTEMQAPKGNHPFEEKALAIASKVGLDPSLMLHALYKETGGLKDPATAKSKAGAYGPMQLMPGTAKELGIDRKDVDQNIYGGAMYLKKMMDKYQDPQLALAAYNAGPGRVDKALRSSIGLAALPRETQNYMKFSQGGEVQHYDIGGEIDTVGAELDALRSGTKTLEQQIMGRGSRGGGVDPELQAAYDNALALRKQKEAEYEALMNRAGVNKPSFFPQSSLSTKRPEANPIVQREATKASPPVAKPSKPAVTQEAPKQDIQSTINDMAREQKIDPQRDIFAEIVSRNAAQREDMKKSAAEDRNLALLAAGLGIMGGTSPYAFANIGQGALKGVEFLGGSKAKRAAELNALNKSEIEALYYGAENTRKNLVQGALERERAIDNLSAYDTKLRKNYFMEGVAPTPKQLEAYENAKKNDPIYQRLARDAGVYRTVQQSPVLNYNPKTRSLG